MDVSNLTDIDTDHNKQTDYSLLEALQQPVCIIGTEGLIVYANNLFKDFFKNAENNVHLDLEHPFYPEYRKRIAKSYIKTLSGSESQCFAILNTPDGVQLPIELYLYPLFKDEEVSSILALIKFVDDRLLSFNRSTLSIISEENFQYDNIHYELSPQPIIRVDEDMSLIKFSLSFEGLIGYSSEELIKNRDTLLKEIFPFDYEKIKRSVNEIINGETPFHRIGEVKLLAKNTNRKIVNITLFAIIDNEKVVNIELVMEDLTKIMELKEKINLMNRFSLFRDITKGFLHTLNNLINVIMSKTQLLLQITEKETVLDGIQVIEQSALNIVDQIRRIQNLVADKGKVVDESPEPLVDIIEDAIEFSRMQFKVEDKENRRSISVEKKYYTRAYVSTNTQLLREIIISMIQKIAHTIEKQGNISISLKQNHDIALTIETKKHESSSHTPVQMDTVNIFSGMDIRQAAEKIHLKIIEEESSEAYAIKTIIPSRHVIEENNNDSGDIEYKLRDLDIIIVEDEPFLRKILFDLFDKMGNRVFVCDDGLKGLEEFKSKKYDLVLTDYGTPGITGLELSARVKEIDENATTILLSGWTLDNLKLYQNVFDLFIPKPFQIEDLLKKISKVLSQKEKKNRDPL